MSLSLQDLQDIAAICQAGSLRKASQGLGITQPALSSRVNLMEQRLGALLFERSRGRSRPTKLALAIADEASGVLANANAIVRQAQKMSGGELGAVRMGTAPIPLYSLAERIIGQVHETRPELTLVVRSGNIGTLLGLLERGEIDFALGAGGAELVNDRFEWEMLIRDDLVVVMRPEHPLAGKAEAPMREVFQHPVAIPVLDPLYHKVTLDLVGAELTSLPGMVFCSNLWALKSLVATKRYATVGPAFCFEQELASGAWARLDFEERLIHEVWVYTNRLSLPLPAVDTVLGIVREQCAEIRRQIGGRSH